MCAFNSILKTDGDPMGSNKRDKHGWTPKERLYVKEYLIDLHQQNAAIRAGFAKKSAKNHASILMKKPHIKAAIAEAMALRNQRLDVSADKVVQELAKLGFSPIGGLVDLSVKKGALDSLARHLGLFKDKIDLGGELKQELRITFV